MFVLQMKYHHALLNNHSLTGLDISAVISEVSFVQQEIHRPMTMSYPIPIDRPRLESLVRTIACKIVTGESDLDHVVELTFATISRTAPNSLNKYEFAAQFLRIAIYHALLLRDPGQPDMPSARRL